MKYLSLSIFTFCFILFISQRSCAQPGILDTSFSHDGLAFIDINQSSDEASDIAIQDDGKILLSGTATFEGHHYQGVARLLENGEPDISFGTMGSAWFDYNDTIQQYNRAVMQTENGKIILAGNIATPLSCWQLIGLNEDGTLDNSFGDDGYVFTSFTAYSDNLNDVLAQPDNKIVASGTGYVFAVARYNPDGSPDASFNGSGKKKIIIGQGGEANEGAIQQDLKIIIAGSYYNQLNTKQSALTRLNVDGSLDSSFGTNGIITLDIDDGSEAFALALQNDGKIIITGEKLSGQISNTYLARYLINGIPDSSFGLNGILITDIGEESKGCGVSIQTDGKIVVSGTVFLNGDWNYMVTRFLNDGAVDTAFGINGIFTASFINDCAFMNSAMTLQDDGKIVVNGYEFYSDTINFTVIRLLADDAIPTLISSQYPVTGFVISPNPFSDFTNIEFSLSKSSEVKVELFDLQGRKIKTIVEGNFDGGNHQLNFSSKDLVNGLYFLHLKANNQTNYLKIIMQ